MRRRLAIAVVAASVLAGSALVGAPAPVGASPRLVNPNTGLPLGELPTAGQRARAKSQRLHANYVPSNAHATYFGGPVVSQASVVSLLWAPDGNDPAQTFTPEVSGSVMPNMDTWFSHVTNSTYESWLTEYDTPTQGGSGQTIGYGRFHSRLVLQHPAPAPTTKVTDQQIQSAIANAVNTNLTPPPTYDSKGQPNTIFAVFFPHNVVIDDGLGHLSGVYFCAYHGSVRVADGSYLPYMVLPDPSDAGISDGCGSGNYFQNLQSYTSHELVETTTDPQVAQATSYAAPLAWYDNNQTYGQDNGEISDICDGTPGTVLGTDAVTYSVQYAWSNALNRCVDQGSTSLPDSVTDLLAQPTSGAGYHLTWTPPKDGGSQLLSYSLYRSDQGGVRGSLYQTLTGATTTFDDASASTDATYFYTLIANNVYGAGSNSNQSPYSPPAVPEAPVDVHLAEPVAGSVTVAWAIPPSDGGATVSKWSVYRFDVDNPAGVYLGDSAAGELTYTDSTAVEGVTYTYAVTASNNVGEGPRSVESGGLLIQGVPSVATNLSAMQAFPGVVTLTWDPPSTDGGSALYDYLVYRSATPGDLGAQVTIAPATPSPVATDYTQGGSTWYYSVVAVNWWGRGLPSAQTAIFLTSTPAHPNDLQAQNDGLRTLTLTWSAPSSDGGVPVTGYRASVDQGHTFCYTTGFTCTFTNLTSAVKYMAQVQAGNDLGWGDSYAVVSPYVLGAPGPAEFSDVRVGDRQLTLSIREPTSDGGSPITKYDVVLTPGGFGCTAKPVNGVGTCVVSGLTNGVTYTAFARATNQYGLGPTGTALQIAPVTVPSPPAVHVKVIGNGRVTVALTEPNGNGGRSLLQFEVTAYPGGFTCTAYATNDAGTCTLTGLSNGTTYGISAVARSNEGVSNVSDSVDVRPRTVPGAPRSLTATYAAGHKATVGWSAPSSNGGSPITAYYVRWSTNGVKWTGWTNVGVKRSALHVGFKKAVKAYVQVQAANAAGKGAITRMTLKPTK